MAQLKHDHGPSKYGKLVAKLSDAARADATMPKLPTGHRIGPYVIVRLLGEGGMGAVYEARRDVIDLRVAVKMLRPEYAREPTAIARFLNEAKILSALAHPSIVHAADFGVTEDEAAYLVMEYLDGVSLAARLQAYSARSTRMPLEQVLQIGWQVAEVLGICHARGIIHRDLKPENIMLVSDPVTPGGERVKLLDFGIAKLTGALSPAMPQTGTKEFLGTPLYMSPEQFSSSASVDDRCDVYSLGCVLYEMLAGRPLFVVEESSQLIGMHMFQTPQPLAELVPTVPEPVQALVHRLLEKQREQRPSMQELAQQLARSLDLTRSPSAPSAPVLTTAVDKHVAGRTLRAEPSLRAGRLRRLLWTGAALGLIIALWGGLTWRAPSAHRAETTTPPVRHLSPPVPERPAAGVAPVTTVEPARVPSAGPSLVQASAPPSPATPMKRPPPASGRPKGVSGGSVGQRNPESTQAAAKSKKKVDPDDWDRLKH